MNNDSQSTNPALPPLSVIVADDALEIQQLLRRWLEELGLKVQCASSGDEVMKLLHRQHVDLVITEIIMPNGDGLEVMLELRKTQPRARVIAMSGGGRFLPAADCLRAAKGLGAHAVLLKPFRRLDLLEAVRRVLIDNPAPTPRPVPIPSMSALPSLSHSMMPPVPAR